MVTLRENRKNGKRPDGEQGIGVYFFYLVNAVKLAES
jgi:hypothetical protein